jgi:hypothetical protein
MLGEVGMLKEDVVQQIIDTLIKLLRHEAGKSEPERDPMNR